MCIRDRPEPYCECKAYQRWKHDVLTFTVVVDNIKCRMSNMSVEFECIPLLYVHMLVPFRPLTTIECISFIVKRNCLFQDIVSSIGATLDNHIFLSLIHILHIVTTLDDFACIVIVVNKI